MLPINGAGALHTPNTEYILYIGLALAVASRCSSRASHSSRGPRSLNPVPKVVAITARLYSVTVNNLNRIMWPLVIARCSWGGAHNEPDECCRGGEDYHTHK